MRFRKIAKREQAAIKARRAGKISLKSGMARREPLDGPADRWSIGLQRRGPERKERGQEV